MVRWRIQQAGVYQGKRLLFFPYPLAQHICVQFMERFFGRAGHMSTESVPGVRYLQVKIWQLSVSSDWTIKSLIKGIRIVIINL